MTATIAEAIERADWLTRYALDRLGENERLLHSQLGSIAAQYRTILNELDERGAHSRRQWSGVANL